MTVVPDDHLMTLICDDCGDTTTGTACVLPDAEVVWTLVSEHGWSGSPFATGPHRCPRCSVVPSAGDAPGGARTLGDPDGAGDDRHPVLDPDAARLRAALAEAVDTGARVVVDLTGVDHIDSTGLGILVRAHQEARQRGATLCLAAPSRFILTVLHTMRLDGIFPVFATPREALTDALTPDLPAGRAADDAPTQVLA